ncbi:MAG: hypothetical protein CBD16_01625 [Betaproteobacteria bacterium TMED156]|nr:MAG: hypothetical protein CBD16_01625 [Betaproteobacteria bacterium TMED156]
MVTIFSIRVSAELPDLGSSAARELSVESEKILGSKIFNRLARAEVIFNDDEATDYLSIEVKKIIKKAIENNYISGDAVNLINNFDIFLIKDPMLNAFALPGGKIGVHTGLFLNVGSEGELMSVLSHELAHITQKHIARMFVQRKESSALMIATAILSAMAASSSNSDAAFGLMALGQGIANQKRLVFSKSAENEADRVGLKFLTSAGFKPTHMVSMLERLNFANMLSGMKPPWFSTHPMSFERIAEIKSRIPIEEKFPIKTSVRKEFFTLIQARLSNNSDLVNLKEYNKENIHLSIEMNEIPIKELYGLFWNLLDRNNYTTANQIIIKLKKNLEYSKNKIRLKPMIALAEANLMNAMNEFKKTTKIIDNVLPLRQEHPSERALMKLKLKALVNLNKLFLAEKIAKKIIQKWPNDFSVWASRALIADKKGLRAKAHIYTAEKYIAMGDLRLAIEQLHLARESNQLDFISLSKVDSKLNEIRASIKENLKFNLQ